MKKNGFTLAEVLVTLGIIGVVAALAMPALNSAVQKTKVGPSLRKFMYSLENANRLAMQEKDVDDLEEMLQEIEGKDSNGKAANDGCRIDYLQKIQKHLAGASVTNAKAEKKDKDGNVTDSWDDVTGKSILTLSSGETFFIRDAKQLAMTLKDGTNYKGALFLVYYDLNGDGAPNLSGKDQFGFIIDKNGAVLPMGSYASANAYVEQRPVIANDPNEPCNAVSCTGAIANNGWKVGYKY